MNEQSGGAKREHEQGKRQLDYISIQDEKYF